MRPNPERVRARNDQFQILLALKTNRKKRSETDEAFVEGIEAIKQADRADLAFTRLACADAETLSGWAKDLAARHPEARLLEFGKDLYRELADREEPSELIATVRFPLAELRSAELSPAPLILVFDRPSDLGNLGSVIRSANAFGVDLVVLVGHGVDPRDPKTIRSSLGAVFATPIAQADSSEGLEAWLASLKTTRNLVVVGTDSTGAVPLHEAPLRRPLALILGNEAKGMSQRLKAASDILVSIPMVGRVNSLNVACAATALLWHVAYISAQESRTGEANA